MGLFGRGRKERLRGTALVVYRSDAPYNTSHSSLKMDLVVEIPGIPAYAHKYKKLVVPVSKWPSPGALLPVSVDPDDHDDVDVVWDDLQHNSQVGKLQAEQLAALMRGESDPNAQSLPPPAVAAGAHFDVVAGQSNADPVERLEKLARLRAAGVVDDQQFAQLRAQILDQAGLE